MILSPYLFLVFAALTLAEPEDNLLLVKLPNGLPKGQGRGHRGHKPRNIRNRAYRQGKNHGRGCQSRNDQCREVAVCAEVIGASQWPRKRCTLRGGQPGLCCPDFANGDQRVIFPTKTKPLKERRSLRAKASAKASAKAFATAVDNSEKLYDEYMANSRRFCSNVLPNTGAYIHSRLLKAHKGTSKYDKLGLMSAAAAKKMQPKGRITPFKMDLTNTPFNQCYKKPNCNFENVYRTIDGSCNNR